MHGDAGEHLTIAAGDNDSITAKVDSDDKSADRNSKTIKLTASTDNTESTTSLKATGDYNLHHVNNQDRDETNLLCDTVVNVGSSDKLPIEVFVKTEGDGKITEAPHKSSVGVETAGENFTHKMMEMLYEVLQNLFAEVVEALDKVLVD